jgi:N-methylhydantoinase A
VDLGTVAPIRPDANGRPRASRAVHFGGRHGRVPTPIYERPMLPAGFAAAGPAVIEEYGTTTLIGPQDRFEVGALGEIRIHCS